LVHRQVRFTDNSTDAGGKRVLGGDDIGSQSEQDAGYTTAKEADFLLRSPNSTRRDFQV
jgi:hypothetical protein